MVADIDANTYSRLPGSGRRLSGRFITGESQRLFLGGDHLLLLRRMGYEESSKQIALNDIQAITLQSNSDRAILAAALIFLMLILAGTGLFALTQGFDPAGFILVLLYSLIGIFGAFLVRNLALGPSCTVRLHTAVQIEELTALRRLRTAQKCLALLVPRVDAAQGPWPQGAPALQTPEGRPLRASANAKGITPKKAPQAVGRSLHAAAFSLCIALGLTLIAELAYESATKDLLDNALVSASLLLLLIAVIRQANSTLPAQTRALAWTLFLTNGLTYIGAMYTLTVVTTFSAAASGEAQTDLITGGVSLGQEDPRWFDALVAIWGGLSLLLGLFGLLSIRGYKLVQRHQPTTSGSAPS